MARSLEIKAANLAKIQARIAGLPAAAAEALSGQLEVEVDELVSAIRRAMDAQYGPSEGDDGQRVRDSVHAYPNPERAIGQVVIADARDPDGKFIAANIEQGHRAADGSHVAARPAFWPTYRARKKGMQRRLSSAARKAIRSAFEKG